MTLPTASVAVVTYERPTYVERCLRQLLAQTCPPKEIIVVDSSTGRDTERLVRGGFPSVTYAICPAGRGATGTARNISYRLATGEVLAFVDDDAFAEPDWLASLLPLFDDPSVGAVGGRQIRQQEPAAESLAEGQDIERHVDGQPEEIIGEVESLVQHQERFGLDEAFFLVLDFLAAVEVGGTEEHVDAQPDIALKRGVLGFAQAGPPPH